jgi:hypothetical protein
MRNRLTSILTLCLLCGPCGPDGNLARSAEDDPIRIITPKPKPNNVFEPDAVYPAGSMVRVGYNAGWGLSTFAYARGSLVPIDNYVDVDQLTLLFTGTPGDYLVFAANPQTGAFFQRVVRIADGRPPGPAPPPVPPTPPGPNPPVPPTPPTPNPNVPNVFGIGLASYTEALRVNNPTDARSLAGSYNLAVVQLGDQSIDRNGAVKLVREARSRLTSNWTNWEKVVEAALKTAYAKDSTTAALQQYFVEISLSLEQAAKDSPTPTPNRRGTTN